MVLEDVTELWVVLLLLIVKTVSIIQVEGNLPSSQKYVFT